MNPYQPTQHGMVDPSVQWARDEENLKLLGILHYVSAGLSVLGLVLVIVYWIFFVSMFQAIGSMPTKSGAPTPAMPEEVTITIHAIFFAICVIQVALIVAKIFSARFMHQNRNRIFSLVIAGIECLSFPLGTALGVFTFIVLLRPSVVWRYQQKALQQSQLA